MRDNKKGIGNQMLLIMVMAIVLILLALFVFIGQLLFPPLINSVQDTNVILQDTFTSTGNADLITAGQSSFQPAADSLSNLEWVSYAMFILMFIVFLIMCFYVKTYPFLIIFWIILVLVMLMISIYLAVVYQDLRQDPTLGTYYQSWENTDYMLQYLPVIVFVMGIGGGIIMFMLSSREQEAELGGNGL